MIEAMRSRRSGVGVIAYRDCVYAIGGFNGLTRLFSCEKYNPVTNQWTAVPEMFNQRSNFAIEVRISWVLLFCSNTINGIIAKFKCDQYFVVRTII
jgi:kelch-like protein 10